MNTEPELNSERNEIAESEIVERSNKEAIVVHAGGGPVDKPVPMFSSLSRMGTSNQIAPSTPLTPQGIMVILQRICKRAGLLNPALTSLRPHDLRRSMAAMARAGGAEIEMIKSALGHSSLVTTERYLSQIQDLKQGSAAGDHIRIKSKARK